MNLPESESYSRLGIPCEHTPLFLIMIACLKAKVSIVAFQKGRYRCAAITPACMLCGLTLHGQHPSEAAQSLSTSFRALAPARPVTSSGRCSHRSLLPPAARSHIAAAASSHAGTGPAHSTSVAAHANQPTLNTELATSHGVLPRLPRAAAVAAHLCKTCAAQAAACRPCR